MTDLFSQLDESVSKAVQHYWRTREEQGERQGKPGDQDRGFRRTVTGGSHLDGFARVLVDLLKDIGVPESWIQYGRGHNEVPGFYRPTKGWDLLVVANKDLLASIEFKSQAGPSYGNNFNNRTEEALGNATDLLDAFREEVLPSVRKPWLRYLFLLEEDENSMRPVSVQEPHFEVAEVFKDASYADRYQILCERLLRKRLYDGACFLLSKREEGLQGNYREPHQELTFKNFASHLIAHVEGYLRSHGRNGTEGNQA